MSTLIDRRGDSLELRTAAYFQRHGYIVRRSVKLAVAASTAEATDIDLLALRFMLPLAEERLVADCRDRRKCRPFERTLWTLGIAAFSRAHRSIVVGRRVPWQARQFATEGGVEMLGAETLDKALAETEGYPFGDADPSMADRFHQCRRAAQRGHRGLLQDRRRLRQMLVVGHPLTNFNRIVPILARLGQLSARSTGVINWLTRYVCYDAAVIASVMLVRFAAETKWTPEKDRSGYARKKLTYGDVAPAKAQRLAQLSLGLDFRDGLPPPKYSEEIIQAINALISQPNIAAVTPLALDFHLLGQVLGEHPDGHAPSGLGTVQQEALRMARRVLSALAYAADLPASFWNSTQSAASHTAAPQSTVEAATTVDAHPQPDVAKPDQEA